MGSQGLTKGSLAWLDYPAQIMFKSTKENYLRPGILVMSVLVFEARTTYVGQVFVPSLIAPFQVATTAMITTARKAVTLLVSYIHDIHKALTKPAWDTPATDSHGYALYSQP
ncbi:hypothetical protein Pyn_04043 [Prunus yedoensis var. nudiflora]|uniref:Uncharacterized protein n=1 Tax=Prunus yedoensis var. nudiflora TaxID=2094558 RepID=A0A314YWP9_PRUYE|nr:hypothetical protein Pyn_04043 [Prunus yedoensis var. nudiflora]